MKIKRLLATGIAIAMMVVPMNVKAESDADKVVLSDEIIELCEFWGEEFEICPELVESIIWSESRGRADARNGQYWGLGQINSKNKLYKYFDLFDPSDNIFCIFDMLNDLKEAYGDDIGLVLMKYHGEKNAVQKAREGVISSYAEKILNRAADLEVIHGK